MSIRTCAAAAAGAFLFLAPAVAATRPAAALREQRAVRPPAAAVLTQTALAPASTPVALMGPDFVFVPDAGALANQVCAPGLDGPRQLALSLSALLPSVAVEPQLVVVLATQPLVCGDIFYQPLANDVRGIGYRHQPRGELFDDTPDSRLEGMAFLNDFPYWQAHPAEFQNDFDHEVGHRWGARLHALIDGVDSSELLGRQLEHWSYFLNSGGSPLEGNVWSDLGGGQYQADTPLGPGTFSDLDLYAMGVLPADQVRPQQLLRPAAAALVPDCLGLTLDATSPPQSCGPYQTGATALAVGIEDVVAVEGERDPPAIAAAASVDVVVIVLGTGTQPFDPATCEAVRDAVPARLADFATATGGRLVLNNLVTGGSDCAALTLAAPPAKGSTGGGCAVAPPRYPGRGWALVVSALAWCGVRRRRR